MSLFVRYQPIVLGSGGGGGGVTTVGPFGSTPNADGGDITGTVLTLEPADGTHPGGVSITTQTFAGNKTFTGTISASNLSGTNTGDVTLAAFGSVPNANGLSLSGQVLNLQPADATHSGGLSSTDWNTFNNKQAALTLTNLTDIGTDGISITNGTGAVIGASPVTIAQQASDATHNGYLSSTDWSTFNSKQASGNYITALTGDGTASGPGSVALTLATVNSNVGSFTLANITVNAKGLVTAASSTSTGNLTDTGTDGIVITGGSGAVLGSGTSIAQHVADATHNGYLSSTDWSTFNGKQASGNYITALTGDVTASGPGSAAATLATVNSNVGSFGSATNVATFTVNGKGLITAASNVAIAIPFSQVSGTVPLNQGGTGQTTKAAAFDALSPMSAGGDLIYGGASGTGTRLPNGTVNQYLASAGTTSAPVWTSYATPTVQRFTANGSQTGWLFTVTSANATVGATYTNNGNTYTVLGTISAGTLLFMSGTGATTGGTLTKATGSGDSSITFSSKVATATYTTSTSPRTPLYLRIRMVGAGGGGAGSGSGSQGSGGNGTSTFFGTNLLQAGGGLGAVGGAVTGGSGGSPTIAAGPLTLVSVAGATGQGDNFRSITTVQFTGSQGGNSYLGGGGPGQLAGAGSNGVTNSGGGGGGGGVDSTAGNINCGSGGGAGAYIEVLITSSIAASYPYVIGAAGALGTSGTGGSSGGAGADGMLVVEEWYQ